MPGVRDSAGRNWETGVEFWCCSQRSEAALQCKLLASLAWP
jgi:hypothetical protein